MEQRSYLIRCDTAQCYEETQRFLRTLVIDRWSHEIRPVGSEMKWLSVELTESEARSVKERGLHIALDHTGVRLYDTVY